MRELKFRQWIKSSKEFHYWGYIIDHQLEPEYGKYFQPPLGSMEDDRRESQQFTGLKDKNGKEIYEGDVFKFHPSKEHEGMKPDNPCVVFWSDDIGAWMFYIGKPEMSTLLPFYKSIEIIGNIRENPELMKEKKS